MYYSVQRPTSNPQNGFTLLELFTTILLMSVLLLLTPVLHHMYLKQVRRAQVQQLVSALHYVQALAFGRGVPVTYCGSVDGRHCSSDWNQGQIAFLDPDSLHRVKYHYQLLRRWAGWHGGDSVRWHGRDSRQWLSFPGSPILTVQPGMFTLTEQHSNTLGDAQIIVNTMGRVRVQEKG